MLFNNPSFFLFLMVVYLLYWALPFRRQNVLLLAASYFFYGWWDWRFLGLLFGVSLMAYLCGLELGRFRKRGARLLILLAGLLVNFGLLGFFKYYNFFAASLRTALMSLGFYVAEWTLAIILPVGISFFVFQGVSYVIDVYRRNIEPTRDLIEFLTYKAFFPQLVAGPIERAAHMLPQFGRQRTFDPGAAANGVGQILWGLFQKTVVADNLAPLVDASFNNIASASGLQLLMGIYCFAFQIYCDFAGYSNIAVGCGRLLGFDLTQNFRYPYFAYSPAEFWRRWHVTLSTWFRDYVYIPLGGNRCSFQRHMFNILVVFSIGGLWHGANWTFVAWGFLNGLFLLLSGWLEPKRVCSEEMRGRKGFLPNWSILWRMVLTFHLILLTWLFFRADTIGHAWLALLKILALPVQGPWSIPSDSLFPFFLVGFFILIEWLRRERPHVLAFRSGAVWPRVPAFAAVLLLIVFFGRFTHTPFIYFKF